MTGVLSAVFDVFSGVMDWIVESVSSITPMFYTTEGLTFLGVLAVAGLAFSVAFLLIGLISNFLHFRG